MIDAANPYGNDIISEKKLNYFCLKRESWPRSADYLYRLMINKHYGNMDIPVLLVLNKQDDSRASKAPEIEVALIKEMYEEEEKNL